MSHMKEGNEVQGMEDAKELFHGRGKSGRKHGKRKSKRHGRRKGGR
jgi:hypothetical protein